MFSAARADAAAAVTAAITAWPVGDVLSVEQFGGAEVNSHNFKVHTSTGNWLCKRIAPASAEGLLHGLRLADWLSHHDVCVPAPLRTHTDALTSSAGDFVWCLWPFVDGHFFAGEHNEVAAAGELAGRLHRALADAPAELWPTRRWSYAFDDVPALLIVAHDRDTEWDAAFGVDAADALRRRAPALREMAAHLSQVAAAWDARVWQPCHGDLHPHNLLMSDDVVAAVVDVESLVIAPYPVAAGFARYKLVRQAVYSLGAEGHTHASRLGRVFARALGRADARPGLTHEDLTVTAQLEVLRRLFLVLRLHFLEGNSRWNHVLRVHLTGLDEVEAIGA